MFCGSSIALAAPAGAYSTPEQADEVPPNAAQLADLPFDQLLKQEVMTANRLARQISDALSAVTIVTAEDIRAYGHRNLADVLNGIRGQYSTWDWLYQYPGGRGFGVPGDFAGRMMLMIDGYATSDNIYGQNYLDNSAFLDLGLVERIEFVPGSGSVIYGRGALLGIINIVTRKGRDLDGAQAELEISSFGGRRVQAVAGRRLDDGGEFVLSASSQSSQGQDLAMPGLATPANPQGIASGKDQERSRRAFAKWELDGLSLQGAWVSRSKGRPTATDGWINYDFNTDQESTDQNAYISARLEGAVSDVVRYSTHAFVGNYRFRGYGPISGVHVQDREYGDWAGIDQKLSWQGWSGHSAVFGAEWRHDRQSSQIDQIENREASNSSLAVYAQDTYTLSPQWQVNAGLRLERPQGRPQTLSPRAGLIYTPRKNWVLKASTGEAQRQPTFFEAYSSASSKQPNPDLRPERVHATDFVVQHELSPTTRWAATVYDYRLRERIAFSPERRSYVNIAPSQSQGLELELDHRDTQGLLLKASAAFQNGRYSTGQSPVNAPRVLLKFNYSQPVWGHAWRASAEWQHLGERKTLSGRTLGSSQVLNLHASSMRKWSGFSWAAGLKNALNVHYDVASPVLWRSESNITQDTLPAVGRTYWIKLGYELWR